jgi:16S rRNA (cytidine1402-2'-O)-methyltransferase
MQPGTLYVVATPIGNLEDITLRALRILREQATAIACEDTRQTRKLLARFNINKPLISYHEHNEVSRSAEIVELLKRGESVALLSDAGTPLISDPGYRIVNAAVQSGIPVVPIPGASAMLAALSASGLPTNEFCFIGFLPNKPGARKAKLREIAGAGATVIAYESPHRILETLRDIEETLGSSQIVLARELTKVHEQFLRGTAVELLPAVNPKGEMTIIISPAGRAETHMPDPAGEVARLESEGLDRMEAVKLVAKRTGLPKRQVYKQALDNSRSGTHRDSDHRDR